MVETRFYVVCGYIVCPGILVWRSHAEQAFGRILDERIAQDTCMVEFPGGVCLEVNRRDSFGDALHPLYVNTPEKSLWPEDFASLIQRTVEGVAFTVGDTVWFTDETPVRQLTGHTEVKCVGTLAMLGNAGELYVSMIANPNARKPQKPRRWLLRCYPYELEVERKRESLGDYGLRLVLEGLRGTRVRVIPLTAPPSA